MKEINGQTSKTSKAAYWDGCVVINIA